MPKTQEIIEGLQAITAGNTLLAVIWHVAIYGLIVALILGWTPSNKLSALVICIPVVSVAVLAWTHGNPFNGSLFVVLAILLLIFSLKASSQPITYSQLTFLIIGIMMVAFAVVYPHFLETSSITKYLYASPVGLIPCPTLSLIIGFALILNCFSSNAITLTLIIFGLFYGIFGVLKLAVYLDIGLIVGTLTLLAKYIIGLKQIA